MVVRALHPSALSTRTGLTVLALVYAAVAIHMVVIRAMGGLEAVPFYTLGPANMPPDF